MATVHNATRTATDPIIKGEWNPVHPDQISLLIAGDVHILLDPDEAQRVCEQLADALSMRRVGLSKAVA